MKYFIIQTHSEEFWAFVMISDVMTESIIAAAVSCSLS